MRTSIKVDGYAVGLAAIFAVAMGVGLLLDFQHAGAVRTAAFTALAA
jgi:hypothetical protein